MTIARQGLKVKLQGRDVKRTSKFVFEFEILTFDIRVRFALEKMWVGHTMDVLSPFISALCHSDSYFHGESCPRLDIVHPGRVSNSSLFPPALLRTHSFGFFAVHETRRIFLSPFISKTSRRVSSFFLNAYINVKKLWSEFSWFKKIEWQ